VPLDWANVLPIVRQLQRSKTRLPDVFLRGVGLPDALIDYLPSLLRSAIEFYSCFISYSHDDKAFARRPHDQLQGQGIGLTNISSYPATEGRRDLHPLGRHTLYWPLCRAA
jgi:hypothetical protein